MSDTAQQVTLTKEHGAIALAGSEMFMPLLSVDQAVQRKEMMTEFINKILKEGEDYGRMPGDNREDAKKVLLKPGAEKLCSVFGLVPQFVKETVVEDWTGKDHGGEPLFYYEYRCVLYRNNSPMGEGIGSANSWEAKYRYRWVTEEAVERMIDPDRRLTEEEYDARLLSLARKGGKRRMFEPLFALQKKETTGQYGKPAEYWDAFEAAIANKTAKYIEGRQLGKKSFDGWEMEVDATLYRIANPDFGDIVNTLQKMGQKRSLVAAALVVTNCSDAFSQDLEDFDHEGDETATARTRRGKPNSETKPAPAETKPTNGETKTSDLHPIEIPADLTEIMNAATKAGKNPVTEALAVAKARLMGELPGNGEEEYRRVLTSCGVNPKGQNTKQALLTALLQVWVLAAKFKKHREEKSAASGTGGAAPAGKPSEPVQYREFPSWREGAPDPLDCVAGEQIIVGGLLYRQNQKRSAWERVE